MINKTYVYIFDYKAEKIVKLFDVTEKSITAQERIFNGLVLKTSDDYDVKMTTPEDNTLYRVQCIKEVESFLNAQ